MARCPKCGRWLHYNRHDTDIVHQCRNSDGTRRRERDEKHFQFTRQTIKWDEDWVITSENPRILNNKISKSEWKNRVKENTELNSYLEIR